MTRRDEANGILRSLGIDPDDVPAELAEQAKTVGRLEMLEGTLQTTVKHSCMLFKLAEEAMRRCRVCDDKRGLCAHCIAGREILSNVLQETAAIALMSACVTAPGSKFAADVEREEEQASAKPEEPAN